MSGLVDIREGAVWMPAGWVLDNALERIGVELALDDRKLAELALEGRTEHTGYFDVRDLEVSRFLTLLRATERAYESVLEGGSELFYDPSFLKDSFGRSLILSSC